MRLSTTAKGGQSQSQRSPQTATKGGQSKRTSTILSYSPSGAETTPAGSAATTAAPSRPLGRLLADSLRRALLKPRSLPLPRYVSPRHFSFTLSECFGHSSFILVAASYYSQDFLELRIMAVLGSSAMLLFTYFHPHGRVLWLPLRWNALFIAINSYRIGRAMHAQYMAEEMREDFKAFREEHLGAVDLVDFWRLVRIAEEEHFEEGDLVLHQGEYNPYIRVVLEGELEVLRDGILTYVIEPGNFVSESGLHAGLMLRGTMESTGTIVVGPPFDPTGHNNVLRGRKNRVRCLKWRRDELVELLELNPGVATALEAALSWDIVRKLKSQRSMLVEGRVKDPTAWTRKREDQGISRYAAILQNMLRSPEQFGDMPGALARYRGIHRIGDADHARALERCGWTEEEFREGRREDPEEDDEWDEEFEEARWSRVKRYGSKMVWTLLR